MHENKKNRKNDKERRNNRADMTSSKVNRPYFYDE